MDHRNPVAGPNQYQGYEGISAPNAVDITADTNANAYLNNAGITNSTEKTAIYNLVNDLKVSGAWDKMIYVMPISPTSLTAARYNLKSGAIGANPGVSAAAHSSAGLTTPTNHASYIIAMSEYDFTNLPAYDFHCSVYMTGLTSMTADRFIMGYRDTGSARGNAHLRYTHSTTSIEGRFGDYSNYFTTTPGVATTGGFYMFNMDANTSASLVLNNTTTATDTASKNDLSTVIVPSVPTFPFGNTYNSQLGYGTSLRAVFKTFTVGFRLTAAEKLATYNAVLAYNTALGRN